MEKSAWSAFFFFIKFKTRVNTKIGFKFVAVRTLRRKLIEFINELRLEASHNSISSLFLSGREKTFVSRNWIHETLLATALKVCSLITFAFKANFVASLALSSIMKNKFNFIIRT